MNFQEMSARSKRTSRVAREHSETFSTASVDSLNENNISPLQLSRLQEKEQLVGLNDRLATYIEKVRSLEAENSRLHVQVREVEVIERKEKENLAARYEAKIDDLRRALDAANRDRSKIELESSGAIARYNDLKQKADKLEKELKRVEIERNRSQSLVADLQARSEDNDNRRRYAEDKLAELEKEYDDLLKKYQTLQGQLEDEVLLRQEAQAQLKSAKEDLDFERRSHSNQMEEVRRKRQVEMTSLSVEKENEYKARLHDQLQSMRADFDARLKAASDELVDLYETKLADAERTAENYRRDAMTFQQELSTYRISQSDFESARKDLEKKLNDAEQRIKDLEAQLRILREENAIRLRQRDDQIADLNREIRERMKNYQELMEVKIQLDTELQAYHKLLEGEESRLHITPASTPNTSLNVSANTSSGHHVSFSDVVGSSRRGVKRRRLEVDDLVNFDRSSRSFKSNSHADTDVEFDDVDTEGRFVRLINKGDSDYPIGGWTINVTDNSREVSFKFHSRQVLKAGKSITVWSSDASEPHKPPENLVMKNQKWVSGDFIRAELHNEEDTVVAWRELSYEHGFRVQSNDDPDQRCSIM